MRKLFSLFAALTLSVGLWAETVSFLYPVYKTDGDPTSGIKEWKTIDVYAATELTPDLIQDGKITLGNGLSLQDTEFYSVSYNKDWDGSCEIICNGNVVIILKGDANLNVAKITLQNDEIYGSGLSICAQSTSSQMGSLTVREGINGAYSGVHIYGGKITVQGQGGGTSFPGIGGFNTTVIIDGGEVTATGYGIGAGIGGSADETALSSFETGTFYNVIINGGTVTATGGHEGGAGIGGDALFMHTFTLINGGQITATGGDGNDNGGSGIGYGEGALGARVFVATSLRVKAGDTENPTTEIALFRSDFDDIASDLAGKKYATIEPKPLPIRTTYVNEMGEVQEVDAWEVKDASEVVTWGAQDSFNPTFYVVKGDITLSKGAVCNGMVNLILADGAKLTVNGEDNKAGIKESGESNEDILMIYGQVAQTGQLIATGGTNGAGIGGGNEQNGARIIFNGGKVTANGGIDAPGIGGGKNGNTSTIVAATFLKVKAGDSENPTTEVASDRDPSFPDISAALAGKRYVVIEPKPKADLTLEDFVVSDNSVPYNGYARGANVYFKEGIIGAGEITVTYKQSGEEVTPISLGEYDIYVSVAASLSYNAFDAAKVGTLTINKATPSAANFTFVAPEDLVYDGNTKTATVTFNTQNGKLSGMGDITIKYNGSTDAPSAAGDYTVSIDIAEGDNYESATDLTKDDWKFSITPLIYTRDNLYDGKWGTICLGYAVPSLEDVTATFYKLNYYDGASSLYVTEVTELEAGKPYVFEAKAELFSVVYIPAAEPTPAETINGLIGTLDGLTMEADAYALVNNMVVKAAAGTTVPANRAYIDLTQVSTEPLVTAGAPRRIGVASAPTGFELNNVQKKACKVLDKGQFVIIRDNKRFNAQGIEIQ